MVSSSKYLIFVTALPNYMRKIFPFILAVIAILVVSLLYFTNTQEKRLTPVTLPLLNQVETDWYNAGIASYHLVVDVKFSTEQRRHSLTVFNHQVTEASLAYWDGKNWKTPEPIPFDQAADYTIPGLFAFLRQELNLAMREDIRMAINSDPSFPRIIYLGRVWQDDQPMNESEAWFTIQTFEPLPPP